MQSSNLVQRTSIPEPQSTLQPTSQPTGIDQQQHAVNQFTATAQQQQPGKLACSE